MTEIVQICITKLDNERIATDAADDQAHRDLRFAGYRFPKRVVAKAQAARRSHP